MTQLHVVALTGGMIRNEPKASRFNLVALAIAAALYEDHGPCDVMLSPDATRYTALGDGPFDVVSGRLPLHVTEYVGRTGPAQPLHWLQSAEPYSFVS
jgi:hypothetical protein